MGHPHLPASERDCKYAVLFVFTGISIFPVHIYHNEHVSVFFGAREECRQWSWSLIKKAMFFMIPDWI